MKILLIINSKAELEQSTAYARRISASGDETHLLAIIPISGDIPTQRNGQVLDVCTEFDLSPMYTQQSDYQDLLKTRAGSTSLASAQVLIGNRKDIVSDQVKVLSPDILLTATELSSETGDFFRHTHASELIEMVDLPVMTYKCDRSEEDIQAIAIISDFTSATNIDFTVVRHIAATSDAKITLYGFVADAGDEASMNDRMGQFAETHMLSKAKQVVITTRDKEKGAKDLLMAYPIQLMVLVDIHRNGMQSLLHGDLESDILNHTAIPILAY